ncbi:MAG: metal ABC transporter permease [Saprospiraceae bacterium]
MQALENFIRLSDPNIISVVLGSILITASSAVVGCFSFLKKKALVGDAVAHSVLPGICLAFIIAGNKDPLIIILGAFTTGWLSLVLIDLIAEKTKIKEDSAIAIILSVFFGIGILLLTAIQHSGNAAQSGLESFLFGKAAALVGRDLIMFSIVAGIVLLTVVLFFKELKIIAFDEAFAKSIGLPVRFLNLLLTSLTVMAVVTGIQAVGVVLMAAILITPAAAARFWTDDLFKMTLIAAFIGALAGYAGAFVSYTASNMPTGPWIVMIVSVMALLSFFIAPKRGIISRFVDQAKMKETILGENLLKELYRIAEKQGGAAQYIDIDVLNDHRQFPVRALRNKISKFQSTGLLLSDSNSIKLTDDGYEKGKRIVKLHRLWEMYLSSYLKIAPDHVHEDAETIEHIITPQIEAKLESLLDYPDMDPHNKKIPY